MALTQLAASDASSTSAPTLHGSTSGGTSVSFATTSALPTITVKKKVSFDTNRNVG